MRKIVLTFIVLVVALVTVAGLVIAVAGLPWLVLAGGSLLSPAPPSPQITYGEFPFTLVYEMEGETISIEDTLVIRHKGIDWNEGLGKHNVWERYLKSQQVEGYVRQSVTLFHGLLDGNSTCVYLELGSCEYYMGLKDDMSHYYYLNEKPGDIVMLGEYNGPISAEELYDKFQIRIIELELSPPYGTRNASSHPN